MSVGSMRHLMDLVDAPGTQAGARGGVMLAEAAPTSAFAEARGFGLWLNSLQTQKHGMEPGYERGAGVFDHDYSDDAKGRPLRYRLIVDETYRRFIHDAAPEIKAKGWALTVETKRGRGRWQLVFEPILSARAPKPGVFWHVTPDANVAAILADGLAPRDSRFGFSYPQKRVYLIRERSHAEAMIASLSQRDRTRRASPWL